MKIAITIEVHDGVDTSAVLDEIQFQIDEYDLLGEYDAVAETVCVSEVS